MATKKTTIKKKPVAKKKAAPKYKTSIANRWMTRKKIKFETVEELEEHISIYFETSKISKYRKVKKQTKNGWEEKMEAYEVPTYTKGGLRLHLNVSNDNMRDWAKGECNLKREFSQTIARAEEFIMTYLHDTMLNSESNATNRAIEFYLKSAFKVRDRETTKERLAAETEYRASNSIGMEDDEETDNFSKAMEEHVKGFNIDKINTLIDPASIGKDGDS